MTRVVFQPWTRGAGIVLWVGGWGVGLVIVRTLGTVVGCFSAFAGGSDGVVVFVVGGMWCAVVLGGGFSVIWVVSWRGSGREGGRVGVLVLGGVSRASFGAIEFMSLSAGGLIVGSWISVAVGPSSK